MRDRSGGEDKNEFRQTGTDPETCVAHLTQQVGLKRQDTHALLLTETHFTEPLVDFGCAIELLDDDGVTGPNPVERTQGL